MHSAAAAAKCPASMASKMYFSTDICYRGIEVSARLQYALLARCSRVWLDEVTVERSFRSFGHAHVGLFASDHHEDGRKGQQLRTSQVVEQIPARDRRVVEVVVADDDVKRALLQRLAGIVCPAGLHHMLYADVSKHRHEHAARRRIAVDDQRLAVFGFLAGQVHGWSISGLGYRISARAAFT